MEEFSEKVLSIFKSSPDINKMGFLSSFFKTKEEDFTDSEFVDIDIVRSGAKVAPALRNLTTGAVAIADDVFTGKQVRPPVYALERTVNIYDLMKRQPGESQFREVGDWAGRLVLKVKNSFEIMYDMIKRSIELQASQVLQTGTVSLTDEKGNSLDIALDFKPKATHFPTVTNDWGTTGATPLDDIESVCDAIRNGGHVDATTAIFGRDAWKNFIENEKVLAHFNKENLNIASLDPRLVNKGGKYMGYIDMGAYRLDLFTYNGTYEEFVSGDIKKYLDTNSVILLPEVSDLDFRLVYGLVPPFDMDEPFASIIPNETKVDGAVRFSNRVYRDTKVRSYTSEVTSRPICIPVSIDRFGCIKTKA